MNTEEPTHVEVKQTRRWTQFSLRSLLLAVSLCAVAALLLGLWIEYRSRQPTVKMVIEFQGAHAYEVDFFIAQRIRHRLLRSNVSQWTIVSSQDQCQIYATAFQGARNSQISAELQIVIDSIRDELPAGAKIGEVEVVASRPFQPEIDVTMADAFEIHLDRDLTAAQGLTPEEFVKVMWNAEALDQVASPEAIIAAENTEITLPNGDHVRLAEIAEITIVQQPSHIVRRWPDDQRNNAE